MLRVTRGILKMSDRHTLATKHIKFKAYLAGVNVPITSFSMNANTGSHTFSMALPPTKTNRHIPYGMHGHVMYSTSSGESSYRLLCDGFLVSDTPFANRGTISRQLIFNDIINSMEYIYFDNSLMTGLTKDSGVNGPGEMIGKLFDAGVMILGKSDAGDKINTNTLTILMQALHKASGTTSIDVSKVNKDYKEGSLADKISQADYLDQVTNEERSRVFTEELKNSSIIKDGKFRDDLAVLLFFGLGELAKDAMVATSDNTKNTAHLTGIKGRLSLRGIHELIPTKYSYINVLQNMVQLMTKILYHQGGVVPFAQLFGQLTSGTNTKLIVVPGMIKNQGFAAINSPYFKIIEFNKLGSNFDSISVNYGNEIPCTHAVTTIPFGAGRGLSAQNFAYGISRIQNIDDLSYIKRLHHSTVNLMEFGFQDKKEAEEKGYLKKVMNETANRELVNNFLSKNTITVTTLIPKLDLVPGFGIELNPKGFSEIYGHLSSFSLQASTNSVSQTIHITNSFTKGQLGKAKDKDDKVIGDLNPFETPYNPTGLNSIGYYTSESAKASIESIAKGVANDRYGSIDQNWFKSHQKNIIHALNQDLQKSFFSDSSKRG